MYIIGAGLTGRNGRDVYVKVPVGTIVREKISEDFFEDLVSFLFRLFGRWSEHTVH